MLFAVLLAAVAPAKTIEVGPSRTYHTLKDALTASADGDLITIDPGTYADTAVKITHSNVTIRGVGGRPHLTYSASVANGKGVIVVESETTHDITIDNLEISGGEGSSGNEAGIRFQGANLTVTNCYIHDNYNGILEGNEAVTGSTVLIEGSEFAYNGNSGQEHNMYISHGVSSFTLRGSYSHHVIKGHLVKTRAVNNFIVGNRIGHEGGSTYNGSAVIDMPEGGKSYIIGNMLEFGSNVENHTAALWYARENGHNAVFELYVINNTYVSDTGYDASALIIAQHQPKVVITNNIILGKASQLVNIENNDGGTIDFTNNLVDAQVANITNATSVTPATALLPTITDAKLVDRVGFDWHLTADAPAVNKGIAPGSANAVSLTPTIQYVHKAQHEDRPVDATLDIGAFEYGTGTTPGGGTTNPPVTPTNPGGGTGDGSGDQPGDSATNPIPTDVSGCAGVESSAAIFASLALLMLQRRRVRL